MTDFSRSQQRRQISASFRLARRIFLPVATVNGDGTDSPFRYKEPQPMTISLVLTFVGDDRPGLVNAISEKVVEFGGSWLESRSVRLAGKFAGVVLVSVPDESLIPLESALAKLAPSGLRVSIERGAAAESERPARTVKLDVVGNERPGIVRDVTQALTRLGVNIEEFASGLEGEPFTGVEMFHATARLSVPDGLKLDELRKALEKLAAEIMVDLAVGEGEPGAGA
jgi:glycine cleavage system regulatory protein